MPDMIETKAPSKSISIVVPIYNVKDYLEECVESIKNQTYEDYELILVDDGSTDGCGEIVDRLADSDERIIAIHKANGGLSDARNAGIKIAKGEYITFIDSDDGIEVDYLEKMVALADTTGKDIVQCGNHRDENKFSAGLLTATDGKGCNAEQAASQGAPICKTLSTAEAFKSFLCRGEVTVTAWGKLYKTSLFTDYDILYPVGKINEDDHTTYKLIYHSNGVALTDEQLYFYRKREGSIMNQPVKAEHLALPEVADEIIDFLPEEAAKKYQTEIDFYRFGAMNVALEHLLLATNRRDFMSEEKILIAEYVKTDKSNPYLSVAHKVALSLTKLSPECLKLLFKMRA